MKFDEAEEYMKKAVESTQRSFNTIRTGRANASLLDRIMVDYYGAPTALRSLANIGTPDASTLTIQPFDKTSLGDIERAISMSDVGLVPNNDGNVIRLNIPPLTEERRKEFVKMASKLAEEGKVSIRNIRRDTIDTIRKQQKASEISEDDSKDLQDKIQKFTNAYSKEIDQVLAVKTKEITTV